MNRSQMDKRAIVSYRMFPLGRTLTLCSEVLRPGLVSNRSKCIFGRPSGNTLLEEPPRRPDYAVFPGERVTEQQLVACAKLFSEHYGVWGSGGPQPGSRVRLSSKKLREQCLFNPETCSLVMAQIGDELVGHAFVTTFKYGDYGTVSWITQLVVSLKYRRHGIAGRLCRLAWATSKEDFACGLVTSHPHAVRALERATGRFCDMDGVKEHAAGLLTASCIPYVQGCTVDDCKIDTQFYVDHTEINELIREQKNWTLGELPDGKEFFAFTFRTSRLR